MRLDNKKQVNQYSHKILLCLWQRKFVSLNIDFFPVWVDLCDTRIFRRDFPVNFFPEDFLQHLK